MQLSFVGDYGSLMERIGFVSKLINILSAFFFPILVFRFELRGTAGKAAKGDARPSRLNKREWRGGASRIEKPGRGGKSPPNKHRTPIDILGVRRDGGTDLRRPLLTRRRSGTAAVEDEEGRAAAGVSPAGAQSRREPVHLGSALSGPKTFEGLIFWGAQPEQGPTAAPGPYQSADGERRIGDAAADRIQRSSIDGRDRCGSGRGSSSLRSECATRRAKRTRW